MLRAPEARDRAAVIELYASPEVGTYIGGARSREELERAIPQVPTERPGGFVVELDGATIGVVTLDRRDAENFPRQVVGKVELGYLILPEFWGHGYATEACAVALDWFADALPAEPVALVTQTANRPSVRLAEKLGFTEVERFEAYGAEQWLGVRAAHVPSV